MAFLTKEPARLLGSTNIKSSKGAYFVRTSDTVSSKKLCMGKNKKSPDVNARALNLFKIETYLIKLISTLLFCVLPALLVFGAIGLASP